MKNYEIKLIVLSLTTWGCLMLAQQQGVVAEKQVGITSDLTLPSAQVRSSNHLQQKTRTPAVTTTASQPTAKIALEKVATGPFTLPALPYAYNDLEPYIDTETMKLHHDGHHKAYVDNLNKVINEHPSLKLKTLEELLTHLPALESDVRHAIANNGGGHFNHSMFWLCMKKNGGGEPIGALKDKIVKDFGSFGAFKEKFNQAAKTVFGSGWAWLCLNKEGNFVIITTSNQDTPLALDLIPLLLLDVWEHAYYLKYHNKRPDYITSWWNVVNWDYVAENYRTGCQCRLARAQPN